MHPFFYHRINVIKIKSKIASFEKEQYAKAVQNALAMIFKLTQFQALTFCRMNVGFIQQCYEDGLTFNIPVLELVKKNQQVNLKELPRHHYGY